MSIAFQKNLLTREIKKRKSAEDKIKKLTSFIDQTFSNIPLSIVIVDDRQKITYANRKFCRAQGYKEEELLGLPLVRFFPDSIYGPIGFRDKVTEAIEYNQITPRFSMQYRGDYYACRIVPMRGKTHNQEDSNQAMILIENTSELRSLGEKVKVTEEKYRILFESAPDGILVTQPGAKKILDTNRQAKKLLGLKKQELRHSSFIKFYPPNQRNEVKKKCLFTNSSFQSTELPELVLKQPHGKGFKTIAITGSPILHGAAPALLCLLKDITEKRFLEEQIRQTEKMSLLGQFTAGAAHEINNPLAIVSSHCQYLLSDLSGRNGSDPLLKEVQDTLNLIDRETRYCGGIIKNLLAYTHTREVQKKPVNLGEVIDESLKMVSHQLVLSNIKVQKGVNEIPLFVLGDANLLRQVLMNLIWNAQGAMLKGGKLIIEAGKGKNGSVQLLVQDTGCGIARKNLENVFTPFFTTKEVGKGTGLGLWVVRSIIDEHQGNILVKSRVGKGSQFIVNLPAIDSLAQHS